MQSEFTALQGAIHDLANLKQELKQTKIFKLNKCIMKWNIQFKLNKIETTKKLYMKKD